MEPLQDWVEVGTRLGLCFAGGFVATAAVFLVARRIARRSPSALAVRLVTGLAGPIRLLVPLLLVQGALPSTSLEETVREPLRHGISLAVVGLVVWAVLRVIRTGVEILKEEHRVDVADNLEARRIRTQVEVLAKTARLLVVVVGVAVALMTFPRIRELGTSLLASAGLVGLIVGLSARPVLENVIAGLQIALTQPIRIDDVVIVGGEWGRIEEITTTYVVVRIWDERRLIVPFSKFISEPFQNWTRVSAEILGTVFLHVDYAVPTEDVRAELRRIVEGHPKWDGRVCVLQVTDATSETVELRALVSAKSSGDAWDLRVDVRERLLDWLRREHPEALPRRRIRLEEAAEAVSARAQSPT